MKRLCLTAMSLLLLSGCAAIQIDLQGALLRAQSAQTAGLLSPSDPLVPCLQYFVGATGAQSGLSVLKGPFAGIVDMGTDLYIIDAMAQAGGVSDQLDTMCGPVAIKVLKNAGRRAPGL